MDTSKNLEKWKKKITKKLAPPLIRQKVISWTSFKLFLNQSYRN
jgi:hypothetical protein